MGLFDMKILTTKEILSGLKELRDGMRKDEYLNKKFSAVLEDAEIRIRSCEWRDYVKEKPEENIKAVFKRDAPDPFDSTSVNDFFEEDERLKRIFEEDEWSYKEGEYFWKPFEVEHKLDIMEVWSGLFELKEGINEEENLRKRYSNLIQNIMERVNSGDWRKFNTMNKPVMETKIIYKALLCTDYWRYGVAWYYPSTNIFACPAQKYAESIWWKPLEVEELV